MVEEGAVEVLETAVLERSVTDAVHSARVSWQSERESVRLRPVTGSLLARRQQRAQQNSNSSGEDQGRTSFWRQTRGCGWRPGRMPERFPLTATKFAEDARAATDEIVLEEFKYSLKRAAMNHAKQGRIVEWARFARRGVRTMPLSFLRGWNQWKSYYWGLMDSIPQANRMREIHQTVALSGAWERLLKLCLPHNRMNEALLRKAIGVQRPKLMFGFSHWVGWSRDRDCTTKMVSRSKIFWAQGQVHWVMAVAQRVAESLATLRHIMHVWETASLRCRVLTWLAISK